MFVEVLPENCEYRGEGNANLVVRLRKEEKVLCLMKYDCSLSQSFILNDQHEILKQKVTFIEKIMTPLLGSSFVKCPMIVPVSRQSIQMLNKLFASQRPSFRLCKGIPEQESFALLLPDYCLLPADLKQKCSGPALSIEIKPKQGFLSLDEFLPASIQSRSLVKCRFCMFQNHKLKKKSISTKSSYCPTDLFSGCQVRMRHALKMLLDNPQNNLRIFLDQKRVFSADDSNEVEEVLEEFLPYQETSSNVDLLCDLVIGALLRPVGSAEKKLRQKVSTKKCPNAYPSCSDHCCHHLPADCVLHGILRVQMLDNLFVQKIHSFCQQIKGDSDEGSGQIGCCSRFEFPQFWGDVEKGTTETDHQFASRKVWEYLVALTMKDCSIMITFQNCPRGFDSGECISDSQGNPFHFSVSIADLDYKTLDKVEKQYRMMPEILQSNFGQRV